MSKHSRSISGNARGRFMRGRFRRLWQEMLEPRQLLTLAVSPFSTLEPAGALISTRTYTGNIPNSFTLDSDSINLDTLTES